MPIIRVKRTGKLKGVGRGTIDFVEKDNWTNHNVPKLTDRKNYMFPQYEDNTESTIQNVEDTQEIPDQFKKIRRRVPNRYKRYN